MIENELTVPAELGRYEEVLDFVNQQLENAGCPFKAQTNISIALDEIFTNTASYAYAPGTGDVTVRIKTGGEPLFAEIQFIDSGVPYNPLEQDTPDITLSAEEREIGGLGIFLVKKMMDSVDYKYDGGNILTLKKFLV